MTKQGDKGNKINLEFNNLLYFKSLSKNKLSGVGFEPTNRHGLVLETNCFNRLHTLTTG